MKTPTIAFLLLLSIAGARAQDYEREARWAEEIVPAIVVGDALWLETSAGRKFLAIHAPVKDAKGALVMVHGVGVHPDHGVIGVLRAKLHDLGWTTLSIQMPVQAADARSEAYYPAVFPEAIERIGLAASWLRKRGAIKVVLVSHSMGSWMANAYFDATPQSPFVAWVCMGLTGGYSWVTYFSRRPILDLYGEEDMAPVLRAAWRRAMTLRTTVDSSRQVMVPGTDHFYARKEDELARAIDGWLATALR
jgi:Protein of unknown function (DUF3530)